MIRAGNRKSEEDTCNGGSDQAGEKVVNKASQPQITGSSD